MLDRARENGVPIIEANVGVTLIISKGEILRLSRRETTVTIGTIGVPVSVTPGNRDRAGAIFSALAEEGDAAAICQIHEMGEENVSQETSKAPRVPTRLQGENHQRLKREGPEPLLGAVSNFASVIVVQVSRLRIPGTSAHSAVETAPPQRFRTKPSMAAT